MLRIETVSTSSLVSDDWCYVFRASYTCCLRGLASLLTARPDSVALWRRLGKLLKIRETLNEGLPEDEQLSLNDFLLKAAAIASEKVPDVSLARLWAVAVETSSKWATCRAMDGDCFLLWFNTCSGTPLWVFLNTRERSPSGF